MRQHPPRRPQGASASSRNVSRRHIVFAGATLVTATGAAVWTLDVATNDPPPATPTPTTPPTVAPTEVAIAPTATTPPTATVEPTATPVTADDLLVESTVADLRDALDSGTITVTELVQASLARIAELDGDDSWAGLHAMIETNSEALDIAATLDQELQSGTIRGPLHGIPVVVKDVFATADTMHTTAGSLALVDNTVVEDAFLIGVLRSAGAVILGKANMSEWSAFRSSGLGSGWSARGGQAVNPYQLDKSPWGSSSGSAIAVAASYVPLALGAETDGSILAPASACGVVGMKPTVGLTSRTGVIPISMSQDSPGPFGRTVRDVAIMLSAIAGYDAEDSAYQEIATTAPASEFASWPVPEIATYDYTAGLDDTALDGMRIGVARSFFGWDLEADAAMEDAIAILQNAGIEIVDDIWLETTLDSDGEYNVLITEFPYATQKFFARFTPNGPITSLADVVAFNNDHADEELAYGDQIVLERALDVTWSIDDDWVQNVRIQNGIAARDNGIDGTLTAHQLDALIAPTAPVPSEVSSWGDGGFTGSSAQISAIAGYPAISIPMGFVGHLPVGMNIFGAAFSEHTLLKIAYGFEQILQARIPPQYLPSDPSDDPVEDETPVEEEPSWSMPTDDTDTVGVEPTDENGDATWVEVSDDGSDVETIPTDEEWSDDQ